MDIQDTQQVQSDSPIQIPYHTHDGVNSPKVDSNDLNNPIDVTPYVKKDGTTPFTGNQSMGTNKLTSVVDPVSPQDAATKHYVDLHGGTLIGISNTPVTVSNTGTETDLANFTVLGNSLGIGNLLVLEVDIEQLVGRGVENMTLKAYYGSNAVSLSASTITNTAMRGRVQFVVFGTGATSTQFGNLDINLMTSGYAATSTAGTKFWRDKTNANPNADSTSNQTVKLTATWSAAGSAANIISSLFAYCYVIKA